MIYELVIASVLYKPSCLGASCGYISETGVWNITFFFFGNKMVQNVSENNAEQF